MYENRHQVGQGCFITVEDGNFVSTVLAEAELRDLPDELADGTYPGYFYDPEFDQDVPVLVKIEKGVATAEICERPSRMIA